MKDFEIVIEGQKLFLHPLKGLFWEEKSLLIIGDLHFGKIQHFRNSGIGLPEIAIKKNLENLILILNYYEPKEVLFLGDLFHSRYNQEWEAFSIVIARFNSIKFTLLIGNHDTLESSIYEKANIKIVDDFLAIEPFIFTHEPQEIKLDLFQISGHIHPGVKLSGKGVGAIIIPCFYIQKRQAILPAFGYFTGLYRIKPKKGDLIYGIVNQEILEIKP